MTEDEKLAEALCHQGRLRSIDPSIRRELMAAIIQSLDLGRHRLEESGDPGNDVIVVDLPIDDAPRSAGEPLRIRALCGRANDATHLVYKVAVLTPAARKALSLILKIAGDADEESGCTPPTASTLQ